MTERERSATWATSIVESLADVIVVLDADFHVTYVSPAIARIVHAPPETHLGRRAFEDAHPDDAARVRRALADLADNPEGSSVRVDFRMESKPGSGQWRWIEATTVNCLGDASVAGLVCTLRDVTDEREVERLKDEFLTTVSHELRTPLVTIMGFAELLRRGEVDQGRRGELLARIVNSAEALRWMVDDLLDFSALEAGQITPRSTPVALHEVVASAIALLGTHLAGHTVEVEVPAGLRVIADPNGLGHVVRNLLTNAANYSEAGTTVTVTASLHRDTVRVEVRDEGIGIAEDEQQLVFDRFFRSSSAVLAGRGTGIGLHIVRRYVDLMGGRVGVRSVVGEGSTFWVDLPADERSDGRVAEGDAQTGAG